MVSLPTESLNKFLAIGSIVAMVLMIDLCLKNYEKAELIRINTITAMEQMREKYNKYAKFTNSAINTHNESEINNTPLTSDEILKSKENLLKAAEMEPEIERLMAEGIKLAHQNLLYERLKKIWLSMTFFVFLICSGAAFWGFRGWYLEEKLHSR